MKIHTKYHIHNNHATFSAKCEAHGRAFSVKGKLDSHHPKTNVDEVFHQFKKHVKHNDSAHKIKEKIEDNVPHCHVTVKKGHRSVVDRVLHPFS
jgi:hypothetical protein